MKTIITVEAPSGAASSIEAAVEALTSMLEENEVVEVSLLPNLRVS